MSEPVTLRLNAATRKRLDLLARTTGRSRAALGAEAVRQFVELNEWQIAAIQKGVQQADSSQFIDHAKLKAKWEKTLAAGDADIAAGRLRSKSSLLSQSSEPSVSAKRKHCPTAATTKQR